MSNFDTLTPMTEGLPGTAPQIFSATTDDSLATVLTTGYVSDLAANDILKVGDIIFLNYNVASVPKQALLTVVLTSDFTLVDYNLVIETNVTAGRLLFAGGGTTVTLTNTKITANSVIVATVAASTNASYVVKVAPGSGSAVVTLSADPGASTVISYIIYYGAQ